MGQSSKCREPIANRRAAPPAGWHYSGREMPSFFIFHCNVVRLMRRRSGQPGAVVAHREPVRAQAKLVAHRFTRGLHAHRLARKDDTRVAGRPRAASTDGSGVQPDPGAHRPRAWKSRRRRRIR
jgi:hypothetical protein